VRDDLAVTQNNIDLTGEATVFVVALKIVVQQSEAFTRHANAFCHDG
jgi:hypothetical protein